MSPATAPDDEPGDRTSSAADVDAHAPAASPDENPIQYRDSTEQGMRAQGQRPAPLPTFQRPPPLPVLLFCVAFFGAGVFALANGLDNSVRSMAGYNAVNAAEYKTTACTKDAAEVVPSCCRNGVVGTCRICEEGSNDCGCSYVARVKVCASGRGFKLMGAVGNPWSSALAAGCSWACHATYWHDCREAEDEAAARVSSYTGSTVDTADCFVSAAGYVRLQKNAQQGFSKASPVSGVIFLSVFLCVCSLCLVNALRLLGDSLLDCMHRIQRGKQRAPASSPSANISHPIEARSATTSVSTETSR